MADKMKKLVRSLSTRKSQPSNINTNASSHIADDLEQHFRKASLTSPIPANTVIHFPQCPHTTPPTPRPAYMPTVLRTEMTGASLFMNPAAEAEAQESTEQIIPTGLETSPNAEWATSTQPQIRQYLAQPVRCLDCTLALADEQTSWINDRYDAVVREGKMQKVERRSATRAMSAAAMH